MTKKAYYHKNTFILGRIFLFVFIIFCYIYYQIFTANFINYYENVGLFQYALNSHDHKIYLANIDIVKDEGLLLNLGNDRGISQIYIFFSSILPFLYDPDFSKISFFVNCTTLIGCYWLYAKICDYLELGNLGKLTFFLNLSLIYFSQLINKDMFTVFAFLLSSYISIKKSPIYLLLLIPVFFLIRIQLVIFVLIVLYITFSKNTKLAIAVSYIFTSLMSGYISVVNPIIGEDSLGDGFSYFLIDFNQNYYIGYLIFNPIRALQYIYDAYSSFYIITDYSGIDTAKILRIPQLLFIMILLKPISTIFTKYSYWMNTPARHLIIVIVSYLLAWLMNPTVNARYVMLITPIIILFALFARKFKLRTSM